MFFGVEWNLKMGEPPTQFYLFLWYSPYGYLKKHPPTHPILIDIRSTPHAAFFMEQPLNETEL